MGPDNDENVPNLMPIESDPQGGAADSQQPIGESSETKQSEGKEPATQNPDEVGALREELDELKGNYSNVQNRLLQERRARNTEQPKDEGYAKNLPQPGEDGYDPNTHLAVAASDARANAAEAKARLRDGVEELFDLYPEISERLPSIARAIKRNPLGFVNSQNWENLDVNNMITDIEEVIASEVDKLEPENKDKETSEPTVTEPKEGKTVGANPPAVPEEGSEEDEKKDLWSKPLTELEQDIKKLRKQKGVIQ